MFELVSGWASGQKMSNTGNNIHVSIGLVDVPGNVMYMDISRRFGSVDNSTPISAYLLPNASK